MELVLYATTVDCDLLYDDVPAVKENGGHSRGSELSDDGGNFYAEISGAGNSSRLSRTSPTGNHVGDVPLASAVVRAVNGDIDWQGRAIAARRKCSHLFSHCRFIFPVHP